MHGRTATLVRLLFVGIGAVAFTIILSNHDAKRADALDLAPVTTTVEPVTQPVTTVVTAPAD